jgi:hypothetical protein
MKTYFFTIVFFFGFIILCNGQQNQAWEKWNWLIGNWKGQGSGQPGQGVGVFSFSFSLDKKIIERKSHSEYTETQDKPKVVHDDLMIVYPDPSGIPSKAIYFDNEGHIINYAVSYSGKSIIMQSSKEPNMPIFRLTYTDLGKKTVNTKFEMSPDGQKFMVYIEGDSKKSK